MSIAAGFVARLLGLAAVLLPLVAQAQTEAVFDMGRYTFENGSEIPSTTVGFVTWGKLNEAKDNGILLVPGTSGSRHSYDAYIGLGKASTRISISLSPRIRSAAVTPRSRRMGWALGFRTTRSATWSACSTNSSPAGWA